MILSILSIGTRINGEIRHPNRMTIDPRIGTQSTIDSVVCLCRHARMHAYIDVRADAGGPVAKWGICTLSGGIKSDNNAQNITL